MKPNFLCVGTQKSGTTTLHNILASHPDICLSRKKETKFFQDDVKYHMGLAYYKKEYYSRCMGERVVGEVDPEYMYYEYIPKRIFDTLGGNVKLVFMLRNPATRAYSHYLMSKRRNYDDLPFEEAIAQEQIRIQGDDSQLMHLSRKTNLSYIDRGYYFQQITKFLQYFSIENMHFILFEDEFLNDKSRCIFKLLEFLDVDTTILLNTEIKSNKATEIRFNLFHKLLFNKSIFTSLAKIIIIDQRARNKLKKVLNSVNQKPIDGKLDAKLKNKIINKYYINDIEKLEKLINKDLSSWVK